MDDEINLLLGNAHESLGAAELLLEKGFYRTPKPSWRELKKRWRS